MLSVSTSLKLGPVNLSWSGVTDELEEAVVMFQLNVVIALNESLI